MNPYVNLGNLAAPKGSDLKSPAVSLMTIAPAMVSAVDPRCARALQDLAKARVEANMPMTIDIRGRHLILGVSAQRWLTATGEKYTWYLTADEAASAHPTLSSFFAGDIATIDHQAQAIVGRIAPLERAADALRCQRQPVACESAAATLQALRDQWLARGFEMIISWPITTFGIEGTVRHNLGIGTSMSSWQALPLADKQRLMIAGLPPEPGLRLVETAAVDRFVGAVETRLRAALARAQSLGCSTASPAGQLPPGGKGGGGGGGHGGHGGGGHGGGGHGGGGGWHGGGGGWHGGGGGWHGGAGGHHWGGSHSWGWGGRGWRFHAAPGWGWGAWPYYPLYDGLAYSGVDLADVIQQLNVTCAQWLTLSREARLERVATVLVSGGMPVVVQPMLNRYLRLSPDWRQTVDEVVLLLDTYCGRELVPGGQLSAPNSEGVNPKSVMIVKAAAAVTVGMVIGALGMKSWLGKKY